MALPSIRSSNRQALTSIRSSVVASSSSQSSRLVHSSAPSRATLLQALPAPEPEEITLAPIFDIFDVSPRLGENSKRVRSTPTRRQQQEAELSAKFTSSLPRPPPSTLPAPIMFDGPARPRNLPLAFQRRVEQALNSAPASTRQTRRHHTPATQPTIPEPLIEMFEGPARLTRYSHRSSNQQGVRHSGFLRHRIMLTKNFQKISNQLLFLGLAGAVGGAALLTQDNFPMLSASSNLKR